ncbi:MAG TPA: Crp/Fnr family transcriptional regulator [Gemmatimonadales bacterium]
MTGARTGAAADGAAGDVVALLRGLPIFAELEDDVLRRLAERCVARSVGEGHVLFTTGEPCRGLYVVETGRVRIYRTSPEGREQVLHVEGAGRPVAELPLFDGGPYPASAVTLEPTRLVFLPRPDFERLYRDNPDVAHAVIRGLGRRLRHLVQVTQTLAFRDVAARLAMLLADYADRIGTPSRDGGVELVLERTQEELSLEIGTARESVSRAFRQLRKKGLVETPGGQRLRIPDVERLRAMARGG